MIKTNSIFICFSLGRSGHHAITKWLLSHYASSPDKNWPDLTGDMAFLGVGKPPCSFSLITLENISTEQKERYHRDINEFHSKIEQVSRIIIDFEDVPLCKPDILYSSEWKTYNVIILRDPFNYLASWFAAHFSAKPKEHIDDIHNLANKNIGIWKQHAYEFLEDKHNLSHKILIKFNDWFKSEEYRSGISRILNAKPLYDTVNVVGSGSSFDGHKYMTNPQKMKVLERWKNFIAYYERHIDSEIIDLSKQIFGAEFIEHIITSKEWSKGG